MPLDDVSDLEVRLYSADTLVPYAGNARTHSAEQVLQLRRSLVEFGWTVPVLVDEARGIIAGHGRLEAAQAVWKAGGSIARVPRGMVPCITLAGLSPEQRAAYVLADNQLALNAGWDVGKLRFELGALNSAGFDLSLLGFGRDALADLLHDPKAGLGDAEAVPDVPVVPCSVPGDVWLLGEHRVICGDSTDAGAWEALMAGGLADLCWTDPPYNVAYTSALAGSIKNDHLADGAFRTLLDEAFGNLFAWLAPGGAIYVAHADTEGLNFRGAFTGAGFKLSGCLVWRKESLVLGRSDYQWIHEPILYGWKPGAAHRWFGGRKQTTVMEAGPGLPIRQQPDGSWVIEVADQVLVVEGTARLQVAPASVLHHPKPKRSAEHPTMKPVELIERMLVNSGKPGDVVVDPFGGSGSTLVAAERLGMKARLVELDPRFCDVIALRYEQFSGGVARLEADGRAFSQVAAAR